MPPARVHEVIAKKINKDFNYDELLLRIGSVAPDCWRNAPPSSGIKDKYFTHFWNFRSNEAQANDYEEFYFKYYNHMHNPICFGYLLHLITDQYWKTNIDTRFIFNKNGQKYMKLINGQIIDYDNLFSYRDSLKIQRSLAKKYNLGKLPIKKEDIPNFNCDIEELNLAIKGLFGEKSTLNYINREISPNMEDEIPEIYELNKIINYIDETIEFIKKELLRLEKSKLDYDKKIKIAINVDKNIKIVNENVVKEINHLYSKGYIVDLLINLPLNEYAQLKENIVRYFKDNKLNYRYLICSDKYLKEHDYDILIKSSINSILIRDNKNLSLYNIFNISEVFNTIDKIVSNKDTN